MQSMWGTRYADVTRAPRRVRYGGENAIETLVLLEPQQVLTHHLLLVEPRTRSRSSCSSKGTLRTNRRAARASKSARNVGVWPKSDCLFSARECKKPLWSRGA